MNFKDLNWRLIILSAVGVAIAINLFILLMAALLFYLQVFSVERTQIITAYLIPFALFSPFIATLINFAFVSVYSGQKKLWHTFLSTIFVFVFSCLILVTVTNTVGTMLYAEYDSRVNRSYE